MPAIVASRHLSTRAVAKQLAVRNAKVLAWIKSGELKAANLAADLNGRPRFRVSPAALEEFLAARAVQPVVAPVRTQRKSDKVIQFFK
jgi:excisionase family DNA binding protein